MTLTQSQKGHALVESVVVFSLFLGLFIFLFTALMTTTQIYLWHQKINQALLCSLNENKHKNCFKDFSILKNAKAAKTYSLRLTKFKFEKHRQRPLIEIELKGIFDETYKIKKGLNSKNWRV